MNEAEAQGITRQYIELRDRYTNDPTNNNWLKLRHHESVCIDQFAYLIKMSTSKYKQFSNYEDLQQEGFMALFRAMSNYNQHKGSFFWWAHKYIKTRISRCANLHTTIRYPLKVANKFTPHKEFVMPLLIEETYCPDKMLESSEALRLITKSLKCLTNNQKLVISLVYGIGYDAPYPINQVCRILEISRVQCNKIIESAKKRMKADITTVKVK